MIRVKQAIIVEGRYDKIRLSGIVDGLIVCTDGFSIYKDREKQELIKSLAAKTGIIILTDSDSAGFQLRSFIRGIVKHGEVLNAYTPDIFGKERRKKAPSKQGKLGIEGIPDELLVKALRDAGVDAGNEKSPGESRPPESRSPVTKAELMECGLIGGKDSAAKRAELQRRLGLPELLSANMLIEVLNKMYNKDEILQILEDLTE